MFQIANGSVVAVTASATPSRDAPELNLPNRTRFRDTNSGAIVALPRGSIRIAQNQEHPDLAADEVQSREGIGRRDPEPDVITAMIPAMSRLLNASWKNDTGF
jgi:hypothetical protein